MKKLVGIRQRVRVVSNAVYKLSGIARPTVAKNNKIIFGGRIAFWLPPQKEKQIVWMSEYNKWWKKELIFTNQVTGMATIYVHMGYGGVASTGEFTNIFLEKFRKIRWGQELTHLTPEFDRSKRRDEERKKKSKTQ